jgi:ABC-type multidrug transport system fused ATPase/permease subunit
MSETNASPKKATSIASVSSDVDEKAHAKTEEGKIKNHAIPIIKLFRFATRKERCMLIIASIFSIGSGALPPVAFVIYGSTISRITGSLGDTSKLLEITLPIIHSLAYMGTASLLAAYISSCLWVLTGEAQARRIRSLYLHSVLKQDMSWFDLSADGSLNTRLVSDTQIIQDGISEKFGLFVSLLGQFLAGFVVAFSKGKLSIQYNIGAYN